MFTQRLAHGGQAFTYTYCLLLLQDFPVLRRIMVYQRLAELEIESRQMAWERRLSLFCCTLKSKQLHKLL